MELSVLQKIAVFALPVIFAITVHEYAHGWAANKLGDPTAKQQGRLTLNPIAHIDWVGTVILPIVLLTLGGFLFGWAKPVPVNVRNLHKPRQDMALVAAAGPLSNAFMAIGWAFMIAPLGQFIQTMNDTVGILLILMAQAGILINVVLMVLNLLPLLPLDGGRILSAFLPYHLAAQFARLEPYGFFILLALLVSGALNTLLSTPIQYFLFLLR